MSDWLQIDTDDESAPMRVFTREEIAYLLHGQHQENLIDGQLRKGRRCSKK